MNFAWRSGGTCVLLVEGHIPYREAQRMFTLPSHIRSVVSHDGAVILDIPRNAMITLNSGGAYIWERLQRGMSIDAIVMDLARETGADELIVAKDVDEFMERLKSKHLVAIT